MPKLERYGAEIISSDGTLDKGTYQAVEYAGGRMTTHPYRRIPRRLVQTLVLAAVGVPRDEIADTLGVARRTVKEYLYDVGLTLNTRSEEHTINRCFDGDVRIFRPVPNRPAEIPAGAQVETDIIGPLARGMDEAWIAEEHRRRGEPVFTHHVDARIEEITTSFGVGGMPPVITICRMAGMSFGAVA